MANIWLRMEVKQEPEVTIAAKIITSMDFTSFPSSSSSSEKKVVVVIIVVVVLLLLLLPLLLLLRKKPT